MYHANQLYTVNDIAFIRVDMCAQTSRTKSAKIILDYQDIVNYIWPEYNKNLCTNPEHVYDMVQRLCKKIVYFNTYHYTALKIPMN